MPLATQQLWLDSNEGTQPGKCVTTDWPSKWVPMPKFSFFLRLYVSAKVNLAGDDDLGLTKKRLICFLFRFLIVTLLSFDPPHGTASCVESLCWVSLGCSGRRSNCSHLVLFSFSQECHYSSFACCCVPFLALSVSNFPLQLLCQSVCASDLTSTVVSVCPSTNNPF